MARSYTNENGQEISFGSGETKELKSQPPKNESLWEVELLEQNRNDVETKKPVEQEDGGDN